MVITRTTFSGVENPEDDVGTTLWCSVLRNRNLLYCRRVTGRNFRAFRLLSVFRGVLFYSAGMPPGRYNLIFLSTAALLFPRMLPGIVCLPLLSFFSSSSSVMDSPRSNSALASSISAFSSALVSRFLRVRGIVCTAHRVPLPGARWHMPPVMA